MASGDRRRYATLRIRHHAVGVCDLLLGKEPYDDHPPERA